MGICHPNSDTDKEQQKYYLSKTADIDSQAVQMEIDNQEEKPFILKKISIDDFRLMKCIGRGAFGRVMLVEKKDDLKLYAMKILKKDEVKKRNQIFNTKAEKKIMQSINCAFIVKLYYAFQTATKLYLVMEFVNGGELFFHLRMAAKFTEDRARYYAAEILLALEHLHQRDIIYRDLKPENVLLDKEGHIKLTDFGLSKEGISNGIDTNSFVGTPEYMAPEVILGEGHNRAVDFWSLGTILYEMLSGCPPFYHEQRKALYKMILTVKARMRPEFSSQASSLLESLLIADPAKRLGARDIKDIKNHPFFQSIDWTQIETKQYQVCFKPKIRNDKDLRYIDKTFTQESLKETPTSNNIMQTYNNFNGFSYDFEQFKKK